MQPGTYDITPEEAHGTYILHADDVGGDVQGTLKVRPPASLNAQSGTLYGVNSKEKTGGVVDIELNDPGGKVFLITEQTVPQNSKSPLQIFGFVLYKPKV